MATRFYLVNGLVVSPPTTVRGDWEITSSVQTLPLSLVKSGGVIAVKIVSEGTGAVPNDVMMLRLVSPKLAAQTITTDFNVTLGAKTTHDLSRYYWHIHAYVTVGDTDVVRGTLSNNYKENITNFWPITPLTSQLVLNVPFSTLAIQAGDRIVIEIGYISRVLPQLAGSAGPKTKVVGPASQIQISPLTLPILGSGLVVMVAGHKDSAGMNFGTCTDNQGNTYSVALPQRRISTNGEFAIIIYYCAKITNIGDPFVITVTGDGSDHCFIGSVVEVKGLLNGLLTLGNISSASSVSGAPDSGGAGSTTGPIAAAGLFARFQSAPSIGVHTSNAPWAQVFEDLVTNWGQSICCEGDFVATDVPTSHRITWDTADSGNWAAGIAVFSRTGAIPGTGDLYYGAPTDSTDLVHPDVDVATQAGFVEFTQNLLLEGELSDVSHIVTQVAQSIPLPPAQLSHSVVQVAHVAPPRSLIGHIVQQVAHPHPGAPTNLSHLVIQIVEAPGIADARISHAIIQTIPSIIPTLPDLSGLYFLNPSKQEYHDSYYNKQELKIPTPSIRTAFLGE